MIDRAIAARDAMQRAIGEPDDKLLARTAKELAAIVDTKQVGPEVALALVDFFAEPHNRAAVDDLLAQVTPAAVVHVDARVRRSRGKTLVFTGTLETLSRDEAKAQAEVARRAGRGIGVGEDRSGRRRAGGGIEAQEGDRPRHRDDDRRRMDRARRRELTRAV